MSNIVPDHIPHIAQHLLTEHGLSTKGWKFAWDNAKRRAGVCRYHSKTISLSRHYVERNVAERLDDVIDTILHEIAHALAGPGEGHGPKWKAMCVQIGAKPERCYDSAVVDMPKGRFMATCSGCGRQFHRHKQVKQDGRYRYCRNCGPDLGRLEYRDIIKPSTIYLIQDEPPPPRKLR